MGSGFGAVRHPGFSPRKRPEKSPARSMMPPQNKKHPGQLLRLIGQLCDRSASRYGKANRKRKQRVNLRVGSLLSVLIRHGVARLDAPQPRQRGGKMAVFADDHALRHAPGQHVHQRPRCMRPLPSAPKRQAGSRFQYPRLLPKSQDGEGRNAAPPFTFPCVLTVNSLY